MVCRSFRAMLGHRWAIARGTWREHQAQRAKVAALRRARWIAWRAIIWPALGLLAVAIAALASAVAGH